MSHVPPPRTIRRDGVNVISAYDLRALAQAVDLKNRLGFETVAVTMGPPQAREALVDALGMGIDRAVHLQDRAFAGSDTLATARALAQWLKRESFDLILLGKYSLDAETGQVGPEIAELLGIAQITGVRKLELDGERILAERESDEGIEQVALDPDWSTNRRVGGSRRSRRHRADSSGDTPIRRGPCPRHGATQSGFEPTP